MSAEIRDRRVRRLASLLVFVAGFVSLLSALSEPIRDRLNVVHSLFPMSVPETAAALAALAGIGLIELGRGIRRGQRRAWLVCLGLLLAVAVLHLIKGVDIEEALVALAAAAYLWLHRSSFHAKTDVARLGRGLLGVGMAAGLTVIAGTLAIKLASLLDPDSHSLRQLSWMQAALTSVERMVGISHISLPSRLDNFFAPAMVTVTFGLAVALMVVVFRPVVQHRHAEAAAGVGDADSGLAHARAIVARHGAGTLDYFALRPDKQFFFSGETVVAHAVYGGVCLVSPDPIGPSAEREEAWRAFRRYVDEHGWTLGGLGAGEEWLPIYRATGMHDLYVGDEAVVRVGPSGWRADASRDCARPSTGLPSTATGSVFTTPPSWTHLAGFAGEGHDQEPPRRCGAGILHDPRPGLRPQRRRPPSGGGPRSLPGDNDGAGPGPPPPQLPASAEGMTSTTNLVLRWRFASTCRRPGSVASPST